jgi:hypothetical protein
VFSNTVTTVGQEPATARTSGEPEKCRRNTGYKVPQNLLRRKIA